MPREYRWITMALKHWKKDEILTASEVYDLLLKHSMTIDTTWKRRTDFPNYRSIGVQLGKDSRIERVKKGFWKIK
jgi:hypothetical protein